MKFVRVYIDKLSRSIVGVHEADDPHEVELLSGENVVSVCFGLVDPKLCHGVPIHQFLMSELEILPGPTLHVQLKNLAQDEFLHPCACTTTALQSGEHALPEPVQSHLRSRWAHRDDLSAKAFRSIGFTATEIRNLPKFQLLRHQQHLANLEKHHAAARDKKSEAQATRLALKLDAVRKLK